MRGASVPSSGCLSQGVYLGGGDRVSILGYADDCVLLADSAEGLQRLIDATAVLCATIGMTISVPKTKTMVFIVLMLPANIANTQ